MNSINTTSKFFNNHRSITKWTRFVSLFMILMLSACQQHKSTFTAEKVEAIYQEMSDSMLNGELDLLDKYLYEGTEILIDMDPDPNIGQQQISLEDFKKLAAFSVKLIDKMEINDEIIAINIDHENNQATLITYAKITTTMLNSSVTEESESTTVFGVINGEIKILRMSDDLKSMKLE